MRTEKILELYKRGSMTHEEIAREVGCTRANVTQTIARQRAWRGRIAPLSNADQTWMIEEAARRKMPIEHLARKLLVEAIRRSKA
jgi:predicted transcriptional regulator